MAAVGSMRMQAAEDAAAAAYLRKAGDFAVTMGYVNAGEDFASAIFKAATAGGGGGTVASPTMGLGLTNASGLY
jgi:hypothetical protein